MYDHYRFHRGAGIGLATGGAALSFLFFAGFFIVGQIVVEPLTIGAVVSGMMSAASIPVGITVAVGAHRRMKRLEPLVAERQEARLTPLLAPTPGPGGLGGAVAGLGGTF